MQKIVFVFLVTVLLCGMLCIGASAQTYSSEYPLIGNSGSPYWLHCEIEDRGEFVILLDPNTNPQAFGFDTQTNGYNLINNTGSTVYGIAYGVTNGVRCLIRFPSYYCLTMRLGYDTSGNQTQYVEAKITQIYGTTLDLIDYTGDRGNDLYKNDIPENQSRIFVSACLVAILVLLVISLVFKPKLFRM